MKTLRSGQLLAALLVSVFSLSVRAADLKLTPLDAPKVKSEVTHSPLGTIVNLWASWCAPCKKEMPELIAFATKEKDNGIRLMLVSGDVPDEQKDAIEFLSRQKIDFPVYILSTAPDEFMKNFIDNWPAIVPTTLLFNHKGERVAYWMGEIKMKDLIAAVAKLK